MATPSPAASIDLPTELRGKRIYLRPYRAADATATFAAIDESRAHLRPWVGWVDRYPTAETTRAYCERCAAAWETRTDLSLAMFEIGSDRFLGGAGLHQPNWSRRTFEIGCWVRATAAYRGHGAAALRLLADFAFARLDARRSRSSATRATDPATAWRPSAAIS